MGIPTNEQNTAAGDDQIQNWKNVFNGPFVASQRATDGVFKTGPGFVHTVTVSNTDVAAKTVSFYDDATGTTNAIETITCPAASTVGTTLNTQFFNALRIAAASYTGVIVSARWR